MVKPVLSQRCRCCLSLHWDKRSCCFNTHCCAAPWTGCKWYSEDTDTGTNCSGATHRTSTTSTGKMRAVQNLEIYALQACAYITAMHHTVNNLVICLWREDLSSEKTKECKFRTAVTDTAGKNENVPVKKREAKPAHPGDSTSRTRKTLMSTPASLDSIWSFFSWFFCKHSQETFWNFSKKYLWSVLIPHENPVCGCLIKPSQHFTVTGCWTSLEEEAGTACRHT